MGRSAVAAANRRRGLGPRIRRNQTRARRIRLPNRSTRRPRSHRSVGKPVFDAGRRHHNADK